MKKNNKKGFTLAELLIVVAIIAVLVAVAIPVFTQQLEKSKEAADLSNIRAAYAEAVANYLDTGATQTAEYDLKSDTSNVLTSGNVAGVNVDEILGEDTCTIVVSATGATINGEEASAYTVTSST